MIWSRSSARRGLGRAHRRRCVARHDLATPVPSVVGEALPTPGRVAWRTRGTAAAESCPASSRPRLTACLTGPLTGSLTARPSGPPPADRVGGQWPAPDRHRPLTAAAQRLFSGSGASARADALPLLAPNRPRSVVQRPSIPAFDIVDHSGRRRRVHPASETDTVGDLARALGHRDGWATIDRRPHHRRRAAADLRAGTGRGRSGPLRRAGATIRGRHGRPHDRRRCRPRIRRRDRAFVPDLDAVAGRTSRARPVTATRPSVSTDELAEVHHALVDVDPAGSIDRDPAHRPRAVLVVRAPTADGDRASLSSVRVVAAVASGRPVRAAVSRRRAGHRIDAESSCGVGRRRPPRARTRDGTLAELPDDPWHLEVGAGPAADPPPVEVELRPPAAKPSSEMPAGHRAGRCGRRIPRSDRHRRPAASDDVRRVRLRRRHRVGRHLGGRCAVGAFAGAVSLAGRRARRQRFVADPARVEAVDARPSPGLPHRDRGRARRTERGPRRACGVAGSSIGAAPDRPIDAIDVVIGRGAYRVEPLLDGDLVGRTDVLAVVHDASLLADVAVPIRLEPATAIAVRGETGAGPRPRAVDARAGRHLDRAGRPAHRGGRRSRRVGVGAVVAARASDGGSVAVLAPSDVERLNETRAGRRRARPASRRCW